jgi:rubrerythrin
MAAKSDIERYRANYLAERDGSELYKSLAGTERDPHLAELYRRMAETEQRHANIWADYLSKSGQTLPSYTAGWRTHLIIWLAKRFGVNSVLPMVSSMERGASHEYDTQPEARAAGMPRD